MRHVAQLVPTLVDGKKTIPLVTDEEVRIHQVSLFWSHCIANY